MAIVTLAELKAMFEDGEFPNSGDFSDLIDTLADRQSGSLMLFGTSAPNNSEGKLNDMLILLNPTSLLHGNVYARDQFTNSDGGSSSDWTLKGDVAGIQGGQGDDGPPGVGIPVGGIMGQILAKASSTDYDTEWLTINPMTEVFTQDSNSLTITGDGTGGDPIIGEVEISENTGNALTSVADGLFVQESVTGSAIEFSVVGVIGSTAATKHNPAFSWSNGWYLPSGMSATLKSIGFKSRSTLATGAGQRINVTLKSSPINAGAARGLGSGTTIGAERTVFTSGASVSTVWDACGQITGLNDALTGGLVYYLDITGFEISSADDLIFTLYVEMN